jgi:hypothetical protein
MKKLFVLTSILALGALSSFAQGYISAVNTTVNPVLIQDTTGTIHVGAVNIGKPATAAGFGTGAGPGAVTFSLYAAVNGASLSTLESAQSLVATVQNSSSGLANAQGLINTSTIQLPTSAGVFDGTSQIEVIWYGVTGDGKYAGWSNEGTGITPATGTGLAPAIWGASPLITSMTLVNVVATPEPATIALGGLGAAALLLFRRRK